jgi:hypothetical protein
VPRLRPGELVDLADAQVRLRIQVPLRVPVHHNGAPTVRKDSENEGDGPTAVYHLTCRKEDRIAICHNITIAALDFQRFVLSDHQGQDKVP